MRPEKIAIVGAGMGGLTAALALRRLRFEPTVYEQATQLSEVGAGIQLSPNAMRVFMALGVEKEVLTSAFEPEAHVVRHWKTGRAVSATPMKESFRARFGASYYGFHRADLHAALVAALPSTAIRLGRKCIGVENRAGAAILRFADGHAVESDIVIGADGIHSVVAESLFGASAARFTGNICWRGLAPAAALTPNLVPRDMSAYFGAGAAVITYYVRGVSYVNFFASAQQADWQTESWSVEVDRAEVLKAYEGWCPTLTQLFAQSERCHKWALFDRDPRPQWSKGRVTLLGDAAHPMLPYLAQGACMAVEDAYALAATLGWCAGTAEEALKSYEALRLPRTSRVQLLARARAQINQIASPHKQLARNLFYGLQKLIRPEKHTYGIDWIYGYDVTLV